jgi:lipoprotein-anchoring transpeptidase ErfK/SrfK
VTAWWLFTFAPFVGRHLPGIRSRWSAMPGHRPIDFQIRPGSSVDFRRWAGICILTIGLADPLRRAASPDGVPNEQILRAQLFLDASPFKPGAIDGRWGEFMRKALTRYDQAEEKTGPKYGNKAPATFDLPFDQSKPLLISYTFSPNDQKFIGKVPAKHEEQAKAEGLPYENFLELVAEKFHARRDFLRQINPGVKWEQLKPGDQVQAPNVGAPFDVQEAIDLKKQTEHAEKSDKLKTEKAKPESERLSILVDVKEKILELKQGTKLVGSYPITPGSASLPAPKGEWFVRGFSWMPTFRWDEAMLQHDERSNNAYELPPGPNNPVGILWMELNHKGSGIHGTDAPETIGRTTSHGCIRLSNWDALDLGKKVLPGVHVTIR